MCGFKEATTCSNDLYELELELELELMPATYAELIEFMKQTKKKDVVKCFFFLSLFSFSKCILRKIYGVKFRFRALLTIFYLLSHLYGLPELWHIDQPKWIIIWRLWLVYVGSKGKFSLSFFFFFIFFHVVCKWIRFLMKNLFDSRFSILHSL